MNNIIKILIILHLVSCNTKQEKINFKNIDKEIEHYSAILAIRSYADNYDIEMKQKLKILSNEVEFVNWKFNSLMNINTVQTEANSLDSINSYLKNSHFNCYQDYGNINEINNIDSIYYYNLKINYIRCILKKSIVYDSIQKIRNLIKEYELKDSKDTSLAR